MASMFKKTSVKLELLTDIDMLLKCEKGIRGGICNAVHRYAKANNKYMSNYDENEESVFLEFVDANNLYGYPMCEKQPVKDFKWNNKLDDFNEDFIKRHDSNSKKGCILEVDVEYPKELHSKHSDLPFLCDRKKLNKIEKIVCTLDDRKNMFFTLLH